MQKIKLVTVSPITCSKGHTFYPKVMTNGTVRFPDKCIIRSCRVYLDHKRVSLGIKKRELNLIHKTKVKWTNITPSFIKINNIERPRCLICNLTFYDQKNLDIHNKRLHQQS